MLKSLYVLSIEFVFLRVVYTFSNDNRDNKDFLDFCNLLDLVCAFVSSIAALIATIMPDLPLITMSLKMLFENSDCKVLRDKHNLFSFEHSKL